MNEGRKNVKCDDFITYRKLKKDRETDVDVGSKILQPNLMTCFITEELLY
jgi:hypothetical protein